MSKRPFLFIMDYHSSNFYPNDLAHHLNGKKVLFLTESYLNMMVSRNTRKLYEYVKEYKKYKTKGEIDINAKERVWESAKEKIGGWSTDSPVDNSFLKEYIKRTKKILPWQLRYKRESLWLDGSDAPATIMRQVVICEMGVDYAKEFDLVGGDLRRAKYYGKIGWDIELDLSKVNPKYLDQLRRKMKLKLGIAGTKYLLFTKFIRIPQPDLAIGVGVKSIIEASPEVDLFLGLFGAGHHPEIYTFANVAGCKISTNIYDYRTRKFFIKQLKQYKKELDLYTALTKVAKDIRIWKVKYDKYYTSGLGGFLRSFKQLLSLITHNRIKSFSQAIRKSATYPIEIQTPVEVIRPEQTIHLNQILKENTPSKTYDLFFPKKELNVLHCKLEDYNTVVVSETTPRKKQKPKDKYDIENAKCQICGGNLTYPYNWTLIKKDFVGDLNNIFKGKIFIKKDLRVFYCDKECKTIMISAGPVIWREGF